MPQYLSPIGNDQFIDANGDPQTGGMIGTYLAGSSTPAAVFTSSDGSTPHSQPVQINSLGYPTQGPIWLTGGLAYKFVFMDSDGSIVRTIDNIAGINDATLSQSEWLESGLVPTYVNGTTFSVPGDQTPILQINRRVRTQNTPGFIYSTIGNSVFAAGVTTVTLTNDSGVLDAGLSSVAYGLLSADNSSVPAIQTAGIADEAVTLAKIQDIATGSFLGRDSPGSGPPEVLTGAEAGALLPIRAPLQSATVTVNGTGGAPANGMLITVNPGTLDFRSATLGSGAINTRTIAAAITGTITSGSTLGSVSGQITKLAILVIDNAGTPEVAWTNLSGRTLLDEKGLISTTAEGGSGGADSATTIYSTTARTNVPYRWVDVVEYTQATAGTYVTPPSKTYPVNSAVALSDLFRSWRDVTGSRSAGVLYRNDTDYDIDVAITSAASGSIQFNLAVDGDNKSVGAYSGASGIVWVGTTVPPHSTYQLNISAGTISTWKEQRVS